MFQYRGGGSRRATRETLSLPIVTNPPVASRSSVIQMIPPVSDGRASIALWTTAAPSPCENSSVPVIRFLRRKRFAPLSNHTRWDPTWGKEGGPGEATEGRKLGPRTAVPMTAAVAPPTIAAFTKDRRELGLGFSSMAQLTTRPARHNPCVSKRTQPVGHHRNRRLVMACNPATSPTSPDHRAILGPYRRSARCKKTLISYRIFAGAEPAKATARMTSGLLSITLDLRPSSSRPSSL